MNYGTVKIILGKAICSPAEVEVTELAEAIRWVENKGTIRRLDSGTWCVPQFDAAAAEMRALHRQLTSGQYAGATASAERVLTLFGTWIAGAVSTAERTTRGRRWEGVNCSELDRLDKAVSQATMDWTALDQTPLPDVSILGGLKVADDLTRQRESERESWTERGQHISSIAEHIAARIDCCFSVSLWLESTAHLSTSAPHDAYDGVVAERRSKPMPSYQIDHKIWTVAELDQPQTIEGFLVRPIDTGSGAGAWTATEEIDAPDFITAFNLSRPRLVRTGDALCVVTQCSFSLAATSRMVYRVSDNPERIPSIPSNTLDELAAPGLSAPRSLPSSPRTRMS